MVKINEIANLDEIGHMDNNQLITFLALLVLVLFFICIVMVCTQLCKSIYRVDPAHLLSDESQRQRIGGKDVIHERTPSRIKIVVAPRGQLYYAAAASSSQNNYEVSLESNKEYVPLYEEVISFENNSVLSVSQATQTTLGLGTSLSMQEIQAALENGNGSVQQQSQQMSQQICSQNQDGSDAYQQQQNVQQAQSQHQSVHERLLS